MKMEVHGNTVRVSDVQELAALNANQFRDWVRDAMKNGQQNIEVDLSQTTLLLRVGCTDCAAQSSV